MALPGVSVVVATRDRVQLLERAVEAVLRQSYPGEIEVIAVFDRSQPVDDLAREAPTRTVRTIENTRTPGLPGARNTGILAASHSLVAFCDDDDLWLPDKLERQVAALERDASAIAAVTGIRVRYDDRVVVRTLDTPRIEFADLVRDRLTEAHPSTFLIRRETLVSDEVGLVDEEIPGGYGEDYDLLLRLASRSPIVSVNEPLVEILWHRGSFFTRRFENIVTALDYMLAKHPELTKDRRGLARINGQQAFALAAIGRRRDSMAKALRTLRTHPGERRALVSILMNARIVGPERVLALANRTGRGI